MENTGGSSLRSSLPISLASSREDLNDFGSLQRGTELLQSPHGCPDEAIEKLLDDTKETPSRSSHPRKTVDANQELSEDLQVVRWDKSKKISYNAEFSPVTTIQFCMLPCRVNLCHKWYHPVSSLRWLARIHHPCFYILGSPLFACFCNKGDQARFHSSYSNYWKALKSTEVVYSKPEPFPSSNSELEDTSWAKTLSHFRYTERVRESG